MSAPLVSVICLCYNHAKFVEEALNSVLNQTYSPVELIIVDDHSNDGSQEVIRNFLAGRNLSVSFLELPVNMGNCKAFNRGFELAKGEFIIDLSADDALLPHRIQAGLEVFQAKGSAIGVHFSDAVVIDEAGKERGKHSDRFPHSTIPQGNIYGEILSRYFICSPTMMIRTSVLKALGGYDESLAYEDFDFWVRSSRNHEYYYSPDALVRRRVLPASLGKRQFERRSNQWESTYAVLKKASALNRSPDEISAFKSRIWYEIRRGLMAGKWGLAVRYWKLISRPIQSTP